MEMSSVKGLAPRAETALWSHIKERLFCPDYCEQATEKSGVFGFQDFHCLREYYGSG
jgi:hypothetical protein